MGQVAWDGFEDTANCTDFFLIDSGTSTGLAQQVERYADAIVDQPATLTPIAVDEDDTAVILYTSGTNIVDRSKDMIIRGGFNVYPRELEEVLLEHPAVSMVAVIGVPHDSHGEEIKAVVIKDSGDPTTEDELVAWGKEQFAAYKYPRIVQFVDAFPTTSTERPSSANSRERSAVEAASRPP